jgi:hypothetical protein
VTISILAGPVRRRFGDKVTQQVATFSTASQVLDVTVDVINLAGGTATTYTYVLPTSTGGDWPVEAQRIAIISSTATGENSIYTAGTATGRYTMSENGIIFFQYWGGVWRPLNTTATWLSAGT